MIYIYKKDILYWVVIFVLVLACGLGVAFSQAAYGSSLEDAITLDAYNTSSAAYLQEGYADKKTWQDDFDSAIGALEEDIAELDSLRDYLSQEELAKLDNYSPDNFKYIKEIDEFSATLAEMRENAMAEKQRQIEQQRAREREQASASTNQSSSSSSNSSSGNSSTSGSGILTPSAGVNWFNGRKETYYNLDMSGVISNARAMGIEGEYWVRGDGVKMYGNYVIVAAQMSKGTIIQTSLGTGIVLDYCPAGTIDIAVSW